MILSQRIRQAREDNNMTLDRLGELVGKTGPTIHKYESGDIKNIKPDLIEQIAEVLLVSPAYLMGWTDIKVRGFFPTPVYSVELNTDADGNAQLPRLKTIIPVEQEAFMCVMPDQSMAPLIPKNAEVVINIVDEIVPGDIVGIQKTPSSYPSLRRLEEFRDMTILRPFNPDYDIEIVEEDSDITIIGKAISVTVNL